MASYSPGDQVVCFIRSGVIVLSSEIDYDLKFIFEILSHYEQGYMVYVPVSAPIKETISVNSGNHKKFNLDKKYIGSSVYYITDYKIVKAHRKLDGMSCATCGDFYAMAQANQPNGTLKCWNCRKYPFYK